MVIYADILFLINFFMDFLILWGTKGVLKIKTPLFRLFLASLLGAVYGVGVISPQLALFYGFAVKLLFPCVLVLVAYPYQGKKMFLTTMLSFYFVGFATAGAVMGLSALGSSNMYEGQYLLKWSGLLWGVVMTVVLVKYCLQRVRRKLQKDDFYTDVTIVANNKKITVRALLDTGNDLTDPLTRRPALIVEYQLIKALLPDKLNACFEIYKDLNLSTVLKQFYYYYNQDKNLTLIPFNSIGEEKGFLIGFYPQKIIINKHEITDVVICLYPKAIGNSEYHCIMNPDVLLDAENSKLMEMERIAI